MFLNIETYIDLVEVKSSIKICRDPKDNFLLALAKDGKANFLLTGDKDLLILEKFEKTKIITIAKFFEDYAKIKVE
jgi:predicted nucleic acid-binding protein